MFLRMHLNVRRFLSSGVIVGIGLLSTIIAAPVQAATTIPCQSHESFYVNKKGGYKFCYDAANWYVATRIENRQEASMGPTEDEMRANGLGNLGAVYFHDWTGTLEKLASGLQGDVPIADDSNSRSVTNQSIRMGGRKALRVTIPMADQAWSTSVLVRFSKTRVLQLYLASSNPDHLKDFNRIVQSIRF